MLAPAGAEMPDGDASTPSTPVATPALPHLPDEPCLAADPVSGRIAAVSDAVSLNLADGTRVRLADLGLPPDRDAEAALSERLAALVGSGARLYWAHSEPDRYGRLHAQVVLSGTGLWLQADLIARGLVFVAPGGMSSPCVRRLIEIESRARAEGNGFGSGAARVMAAGDPAIGDRLGEFVTVEGTVASVGGSQRNVYLNFGDDWSKDFTVIASRRDIKRWPDAGEDLARLEGERVRVRGYVERWNGPLIRIEHPAQVEVRPSDP